jgi:hypothetical protein
MSVQPAGEWRAIHRHSAVGLLVVLAAVSSGRLSAAPIDCVGIGSDAERLACYDHAFGRLAIAPADKPLSIAPPPVLPVPAPSAAAISVPPAASSTNDSVISVPQPAVSAPTAESFGRASVPVEPATPEAAKEPYRIVARVIGRVDGPARGQELLLDNGQRWRNIDDRELDHVGDNPQVTLWRNLIGSYWLRFEPRGPQLRVRRVK